MLEDKACEKHDKRSFLEDADGDLSSGRLMKLTSFFIAIFFAALGGLLLFFAKEALAPELNSYLIAIVGMFLGVATSAEIVQKIKGL